MAEMRKQVEGTILNLKAPTAVTRRLIERTLNSLEINPFHVEPLTEVV